MAAAALAGFEDGNRADGVGLEPLPRLAAPHAGRLAHTVREDRPARTRRLVAARTRRDVVPVDYRTTVAAAGLSGGRVALSLKVAGGGTRQLDVDHVIAGTGYGVNVDRLEFIAPDLGRLARTESAPLLTRCSSRRCRACTSSVPCRR